MPSIYHLYLRLVFLHSYPLLSLLNFWRHIFFIALPLFFHCPIFYNNGSQHPTGLLSNGVQSQRQAPISLPNMESSQPASHPNSQYCPCHRWICPNIALRQYDRIRRQDNTGPVGTTICNIRRVDSDWDELTQ